MATVLGVDTSNYTTSLAICKDGEIIAQKRRILDVKEGERGLRQSDAVFAHVKNLPALAKDLMDDCGIYAEKIDAIGYSAYPRDIKGSYMPCFLTGEMLALCLGAICKKEVYKFSHQCGHIAAALYETEFYDAYERAFASFHVSGGTTEILLCTPDEEKIFDIKKIGGTLDLNAGQTIDRAGVLMGLKFPCGAELEHLAKASKKRLPVGKISVNRLNCNLSGLENKVIKLLNEKNSNEDVAYFTLSFVAKTLDKLSENLRCEYSDIPIVYAGGVMSNAMIRSVLSQRENTHFAKAGFSSDNAAGISLLCHRKIEKN